MSSYDRLSQSDQQYVGFIMSELGRCEDSGYRIHLLDAFDEMLCGQQGRSRKVSDSQALSCLNCQQSVVNFVDSD